MMAGTVFFNCNSQNFSPPPAARPFGGGEFGSLRLPNSPPPKKLARTAVGSEESRREGRPE